jgi:hypothetical protein
MATLQMFNLLGYSILYPDLTPKEKAHYAGLIGRDLLLQTSCHFLSYFRLNAVPPLEHLIQEWFTYNNNSFAVNPDYPDVIRRLMVVRQQFPGANIQLLTVESFLRMFTWLLENPQLTNEVRGSGPKQCLPLFQLYLLFNEEVAKALKHGRESVESPKDDKRFIRLILVNSFPQQDFINIDYAQLLMTQFYKAAKLFDFLSADPAYAALLERFLASMHCRTKEDYFSKIGPAVIGGLVKQTPGWTILNVPDRVGFEESCEFLENLAIRADASPQAEENDYLLLRSNPLHELAKGKYRVIFDAFMIKKVYNGMLFHLFALAKNKSIFPEDLPGTLRDKFSEGTLLYGVLNEMYPDPEVVKIPGSKFKEVYLPTEPDFYLRLGRIILLFESKDFYMRGVDKLSHDFGKIGRGRIINPISFSKKMLLELKYILKDIFSMLLEC